MNAKKRESRTKLFQYAAFAFSRGTILSESDSSVLSVVGFAFKAAEGIKGGRTGFLVEIP
jgi:hypothetical protein